MRNGVVAGGQTGRIETPQGHPDSQVRAADSIRAPLFTPDWRIKDARASSLCVAIASGQCGRLLALFLAVSMVFLVASASSAMADPTAPAPTISRDKDDYAPGETVTLSGSN